MRDYEGTGMAFFSEVDLDGNPVERSRASHPYPYSPYVMYRNGGNEEIKTCVYSDRLFQWDSKKYNELCEKHFGNTGQHFSSRSPDTIEKFLKDYMDDQSLKLIVIQEGANMSSGYPYWVFHYSLNRLS